MIIPFQTGTRQGTIMTTHLFTLESLPNEILTGIFRFLYPSHLFRAFYNLNSRFNILLQSLPSLTLSLPTDHDTDDDFFPYIRVLIINRAVDVNLSRFLRVQSLVLRYPTEKLLAQLDLLTLPHLEYLHLNHMHNSVSNRIPDLCRKTFSNAFPRLKCCHLLEWGSISKSSEWTLSPSLHTLKVGKIDLLTYKAILSSCPNLFFLQLATVVSSNTSTRVVPHYKLKRLIVRATPLIQPWRDRDIDSCLAFVPNLEFLSIHQTYHEVKRKNDWLASIIACRLPSLQQFDFYFHICDTGQTRKEDFPINPGAMEEAFQLAHHRQYQSRMIINRTRLF